MPASGPRALSAHLAGPDKAAILLLSLERNHAEEIVSQLDDDELKILSRAMAGIGRVDSAVVEDVLRQFVERVSYSSDLTGNFSSAEKLLRSVLPTERADAILEEITGSAIGQPGVSMWERLSQVNEELLANYLKNEYPQTIALILSRIDPIHASAVMTHLPDQLNLQIMLRILKMETVHRDVIEDIERTLHSEFISNLGHTQKRDSYELLAEVFNAFDRSTETRLMELLESQDYESATHVKALMFTFEDFTRIEPAGIQLLLRNLNKAVLAVALKGAPKQMQDLFLTNMSERAQKVLQEDMAALGAIRLKKIEEAQQQLVQTAKEMSDRGEIEILQRNQQEDRLIR